MQCPKSEPAPFEVAGTKTHPQPGVNSVFVQFVAVAPAGKPGLLRNAR